MIDRLRRLLRLPAPAHPIGSGGRITGLGNTAGTPAVLSRGLAVISREQADQLSVGALSAINGGPTDYVIVEPDGTLAGDEETIARAAACGLLRQYEATE